MEKCENTITQVRACYVDHIRDPGKHNILIVGQKHTISAINMHQDLPYYVLTIKRRNRYVKLRWINRNVPNHEVIVELDNIKSFRAFNRFEEEGYVEQRYNNFRLIDLRREKLCTIEKYPWIMTCS